MIAKIKGTIDELKPTEVIVDVAGIGYRCLIPFSTYEKLLGVREVCLHTVTYHREEHLKLYGFFTSAEREMFAILTGVSGVGPAMALSILSGIRLGELVDALVKKNIAPLVRIPGIGKTKAEKLVFELARKIKKFEHLVDDIAPLSRVRDEAVEALVSLGFDEDRSGRAVNHLLEDEPEAGIETVIKKALQVLST